MVEEKARKIIKHQPEFSLENFKTLWGIKGASSNIIAFYNDYIKLLDGKQKQQKWNYHNAKIILLKFFNKEKYIDFREITPAKLEFSHSAEENILFHKELAIKEPCLLRK